MEKILNKLLEYPEVRQYIDELDKESKFRQRLVQARKDAGIHQKTIGMLTGLNQRAISRVETNNAIGPNLRTLVNLLVVGFDVFAKSD